ncbi:MAG: D-cysteine desulfhydrase family protein [Thaumarchaeota archaeon]|nr:D-cysteine desulfhydrase family protein [Nitrososphaerota archaeon]
MQIRQLERIGIGNFPTPLEALPRLSSKLGPRIFVKREDMTGLAMGGNKVRKLDYLLVDALKKKSDILITTSGLQSNWARQTTAAAVKLGMKALLMLRTAQFKEVPTSYDGNLLLDHLMGAEVRFLKMEIDSDPSSALNAVSEELKKKGHNPYLLHLSAAESPLTTVAYVDAMKEIVGQSRGEEFDHVVVAAGGGSTQAGLALGAKILKLKTKVWGINVGAFKKSTITDTIVESSAEASELLGETEKLDRDEINISDEYFGEGYGINTPASLEAIKLTASSDALIIDPVYTAKAMSGLVDLCRKGFFKKSDKICFIHTGGVPALFAYRDSFPMSQQNKID